MQNVRCCGVLGRTCYSPSTPGPWLAAFLFIDRLFQRFWRLFSGAEAVWAEGGRAGTTSTRVGLKQSGRRGFDRGWIRRFGTCSTPFSRISFPLVSIRRTLFERAPHSTLYCNNKKRDLENEMIIRELSGRLRRCRKINPAGFQSTSFWPSFFFKDIDEEELKSSANPRQSSLEVMLHHRSGTAVWPPKQSWVYFLRNKKKSMKIIIKAY